MKIVERFRNKVMAGSLLLIGAGCLIGLIFSRIFAMGLLAGGVVSCALFFVNTWMSQRLLSNNWSVVVYVALLPLVRIGAYVSVLLTAFSFDKNHWTGFAGAAAGLGVVYVMSALIGYTGWDLDKETK